MISDKVKIALIKAAPTLSHIQLIELVIEECKQAQRQWVGLTNIEWADLYEAHHDKYDIPKQGSPDGMDYERAIEAKLKEKNA